MVEDDMMMRRGRGCFRFVIWKGWMDDDVTSWMDCLYYYLVSGATLPIFLVHGCAASVQGVLTLCLLVHAVVVLFWGCWLCGVGSGEFLWGILDLLFRTKPRSWFLLGTCFSVMKTLLVPEYHTLKYTKKVKIPQEGSQPVSNESEERLTRSKNWGRM